ncbi:hypothetical protein CPB86DRAFT_600914 [Serendipita vermifera]|nr:hypothetical protein CPB86DRAFT_600914 [Serendipita vermifera]
MIQYNLSGLNVHVVNSLNGQVRHTCLHGFPSMAHLIVIVLSIPSIGYLQSHFFLITPRITDKNLTRFEHPSSKWRFNCRSKHVIESNSPPSYSCGHSPYSGWAGSTVLASALPLLEVNPIGVITFD